VSVLPPPLPSDTLADKYAVVLESQFLVKKVLHYVDAVYNYNRALMLINLRHAQRLFLSFADAGPRISQWPEVRSWVRLQRRVVVDGAVGKTAACPGLHVLRPGSA
jgi:hypothetical protein